MKMARATEQDLESALTVSRIIEELEKGYLPGDDNAEETEFFDQNDLEHCKRALDAILSAAHQGSIFRVTFGMAVVLDPRNKLLDPDADTLELHPDLVRKAASVAAPAAGDALGTVTPVTRPGRGQELFTYSSQPSDNVIAWRIGEACSNASRASAGDYIDRGLGLLKELQAKGYGIAALSTSQQQEG